MSAQQRPESGPYLRLYHPPAETSQPVDGRRKRRGRRTLQQVFEKVLRPQMITKNRKPSTIRDIERALEKWQEYWIAKAQAAAPAGTTIAVAEVGRGARIPYPLTCSRVKLRHLEEWQRHLLQTAGTHTVNRYLGAIRQVLIAAQKRGFVSSRPMLEKLPEKAAAKWYMRREQVELLWRHADGARWPTTPGMEPGDWWRCFFVLLWTYGFRTQELFAFHADKSGLCWAAISTAAETPNPVGTAENALGWLTYTPPKQSWAKPEPLYLPLTATARAALDRLRAAAPAALPTDAIIPWAGAHKSMYREWQDWQTRAGVANKAGDLFQLKSIRKSASTYLETHHKGLGAAVLGHADRDVSVVNARHYTVDELTLVEQLASYPVPDCFHSINRANGQLKLF